MKITETNNKKQMYFKIKSIFLIFRRQYQYFISSINNQLIEKQMLILYE